MHWRLFVLTDSPRSVAIRRPSPSPDLDLKFARTGHVQELLESTCGPVMSKSISRRLHAPRRGACFGGHGEVLHFVGSDLHVMKISPTCAVETMQKSLEVHLNCSDFESGLTGLFTVSKNSGDEHRTAVLGLVDALVGFFCFFVQK